MEPKLVNLFPHFQHLGSAARFAEEIHEIVDHAPLFEELNHQEIEAMCSFMTCYAAPRESVLIREGEAGDFLIIVLTGTVDIFKRGLDGQDVRVATISPGGTVGEMSMIDSEPRFATCISDEPVDFAVLTRQALNDILMALPRFGNKLLLLLLHMVTDRLRKSTNQLVHHNNLVVV
jgi:CRP-like cAMP-binding protein